MKRVLILLAFFPVCLRAQEVSIDSISYDWKNRILTLSGDFSKPFDSVVVGKARLNVLAWTPHEAMLKNDRLQELPTGEFAIYSSGAVSSYTAIEWNPKVNSSYRRLFNWAEGTPPYWGIEYDLHIFALRNARDGKTRVLWYPNSRAHWSIESKISNFGSAIYYKGSGELARRSSLDTSTGFVADVSIIDDNLHLALSPDDQKGKLEFWYEGHIPWSKISESDVRVWFYSHRLSLSIADGDYLSEGFDSVSNDLIYSQVDWERVGPIVRQPAEASVSERNAGDVEGYSVVHDRFELPDIANEWILYSALGQKRDQYSKLTHSSIDLSNIPDGLYFLRSKDGANVIRLIKNH